MGLRLNLLAAILAGGAAGSGAVGSVTIAASRTTAPKDYLTDSAAFHLTAPLPTGLTLDTAHYIWRWTDATGAHEIIDDINGAIRIMGDGSASYQCTVRLIIVDGDTLAVTDADGTAMDNGDASGSIVLTVTNNAAATVYSVTKTGTAIVASVGGTPTYFADESTGLSGNTGLSVGSPKQYLSQLVALDLTNSVWALADATAQTYTMDSIAGTPSNLEIVGAVSGQVPVLDFANASEFATTLSLSTGSTDVRLVNVRRTNSTDSRGLVLYLVGAVSHVSMFDVVVDNCDRWFSADSDTCDTDGLYFHGGSWTGGGLTGYLAGRSQHVGLVDVDMLQEATYTGDSNQAQIRVWNARRWSVRGGSHIKRGATNPIFRFLMQTSGLYWDDGGGVPLSSWLSWNGAQLTHENTTPQNLVALNQDLADGGGPTAGRYRNVLFSNSVLDRTVATANEDSAAVGNNSGPEYIDGIVFRNCRAGRDAGDLVESGGAMQLYFFTCPVLGGPVAAHNEIILLPYRASYAGLYCRLLGSNASVTGAKLFNNFAAYNAQTVNDPGEAMLRFDGIDTATAANFVGSGNKWAKAPLYGSNAATRFASNSGGGLTRAQWLVSTGGLGDQGYDWTASDFTTTHYNLTGHTVRSGSALNTDTVARTPYCIFTGAGLLRAASTTAHRGDPSASANPYT